jgi:hypothetical protein
MNGARTYENYNFTLSAQNVLELENIPETVNRDSSFISRIMSMLFAKHEMMNSNVPGNNSSNPKLNQISQSPLDKNKKNFIVKMFSLHISTDLANSKFHNNRLKKISQHMNSNIQNVRVVEKRPKQ